LLRPCCKPCKPDFVRSIAAALLPFIWVLPRGNTLSAYPQASDEQPSNACLLGISSRKACPQQQLPAATVCSYHTFSPLPLKAVIFCGAVCIFLSKNPIR